jgi:CheY-like chemotaxis protein
LLGILNDILDFSKIEAGQLALEEIKFDLQATVGTMTDMIVHLAREKELELNIFIHRDVPEYLIGDPSRLNQILLNLVGNSVKFTKQGDVTLRIEPVQILTENVLLHFSISDTGIGILPDRIDAIFDSFTQADSSTTRQFGGTGLGVTIAKQLVEMMGGKIRAESPTNVTADGQIKTPGGPGTAFHFDIRFPYGKHKHGSIALPEDIAGIKVLVVDDNPTNLFILREMLETFGCNPDTFQEPETALNRLKNSADYQLVITDYQMPGMDGVRLIQEIQQSDALKNLPIILLTSIDKNQIQSKIINSEKIRVIEKPIKIREFYHGILEMFGHTRNSQGQVQPGREKPAIAHYAEKFASLPQPIRILLAEDNVVNQIVAASMLKKMQLQVESVNDGFGAVNALRNNQYDLVLMDVQMPNLDGLAATEKIRNELKIKEVPIIALTAHAMKGDREKCLEVGMNDYISKPIEAETLYRILLKWLTRD